MLKKLQYCFSLVQVTHFAYLATFGDISRTLNCNKHKLQSEFINKNVKKG